MNLDRLFQEVVADAVYNSSEAALLLKSFLPPDPRFWELSEAQPGTAREGHAMLAYPTQETAGLYLVICNPETETALPAPGSYLLEIMGDTPENGCELLIVRRISENFEVLYVDDGDQ